MYSSLLPLGLQVGVGALEVVTISQYGGEKQEMVRVVVGLSGHKNQHGLFYCHQKF